MMIPHTARIVVLVVGATAFYGYVGQMVPQNEVQPPEEIVIRADLTTPEMVEIGRGIAEGKGLCLTCHTIGQSGALRFPDLAGIASRAAERVPGLSDLDYLAQSMYEPDVYIVEGFTPGMPAIHRPPIGLTDQEILTVIAFLQSLGGTPTVTLQTSHRYYAAPGAPGAAPPPGDQKAEPGEALPLDALPLNAAPAKPLVPPGSVPVLRPPTNGMPLASDALSPDMIRDTHGRRLDGALTR